MQFGITVVLLTLGGAWLDRRLHTSPVFLLIGMVLGATAGFYSMYRKLTDAERQERERRKAREEEK